MMNKLLLQYCFLWATLAFTVVVRPFLLAETNAENPTMPENGFSSSARSAPAEEVAVEDLKTPGAVYFIPPSGWQFAQLENLNPNVQIMVVGKGKGAIPPSINLTVEPFKGTLKDYLKIVKSINASKGNAWKDLGKIKTEAGEGSLSQLDTTIRGENVRMLHTIVAKNGLIYILTASALKVEFPSYYKQFFDAMSSLHINEE